MARARRPRLVEEKIARSQQRMNPGAGRGAVANVGRVDSGASRRAIKPTATGGGLAEFYVVSHGVPPTIGAPGQTKLWLDLDDST